MTEKFNFDEAFKAIQSGQAVTGKDGALGRWTADPAADQGQRVLQNTKPKGQAQAVNLA
jgi:hypothetical protein